MLFYHLTLTSLALFLPAQIAAQCSACTSYTAALKSCQTGSANLTQIGSVVDTDDVHCMCQSSSSYTEMNSCTGCTETDYTLEESIDPTILDAWTSTCNADNLYDDKQAVACWQGQPTNYLPCIERTGDTTGGGSSPSTTLPQSTSGPNAATPSAKLKSAGPLSFPMSIAFSIVLITFGMVMGL